MDRVLNDEKDSIANIFSGSRKSDIWNETIIWDDDDIIFTSKVGCDVCINETERVWRDGSISRIETTAVNEE